MKYSQRQNMNLGAAQLANAQKWNTSLLDGIQNKFGFVPDKFHEKVMGVNKRVARIIPKTYEDFDDLFKGIEILRDEPAIRLVEGADKKTGFPVLYVYVPEYDSIIRQNLEKGGIQKNLKRISSLFQKQNGRKEQKLEDFILGLPADLPFQTYFDGSRKRVANLGMNEGAVLYGDTSADVFAVVYNHRDTQVVTFFVNGLDYVQSFANQLVRQLELSNDLANQISSALGHDRYYSIQTPVAVDFERYATEMARLLKVEAGQVVTDLLQGDVDVVTGAFSQKLALDLDDELPSAVLVGGRVNVFLPR